MKGFWEMFWVLVVMFLMLFVGVFYLLLIAEDEDA